MNLPDGPDKDKDLPRGQSRKEVDYFCPYCFPALTFGNNKTIPRGTENQSLIMSTPSEKKGFVPKD